MKTGFRVFEVMCVALLAWAIPADGLGQERTFSREQLAAKTLKARESLDTYYGKRANLRRAQEEIDEVLAAQPKFVPAMIQAARVTIMGGHIAYYEFKGGTIEGAERILLQARELEPNNAEVHGLLGHVRFLKSDYPGAIESLDRAKSLKLSNPWLNNNYGDVYQKLGKNDLAGEHYRMVATLGQGSSAQQRRAYIHALSKLQWLAVLKEDDAEVLRLAKLATEAAPSDDAWTWSNTANILFIQGHFDETIAYARKALTIMNYGAARTTLALGLYGKWASLAAKGRAREAEKHFEEAFALNAEVGTIATRFGQASRPVAALEPMVRKRLNEAQKR